MVDQDGRYIMLISVHGLIRGRDMELGRDVDTGGQTTYVVELARALIQHPAVSQVDLVTRLVVDPRVDAGYAEPVEELAPGARIVRIRCGPDRYLPKESLWPHLDSFADNLVLYIRSKGRAPDLVHGHYADAGYVASCVSGLLRVPMAFTGHSLGRVKRERLLAQGSKPEAIERRYHISQRIEAEETALDNAAFVIASTHQEVEDQYSSYDNHQPRRMIVIPPGVDLSRFTPPSRSSKPRPPIYHEVTRFLADRSKPMILAISRPDARKNIATLIRAFGENEDLRELANLVIVAGTRDDICKMDKGAREVLSEILYLVDAYDLYGSVAYPKRHAPDDVPEFYRIAADTKGVFVNPALTEPFGLTLLEAAASGLPIVATEDGGPREIVAHCKNGLLVDPLNVKAMGEVLLQAVGDRQQWKKWSRSGLRGAHKHFSWTAHADKYMRAARTAITYSETQHVFYSVKSRLITADRLIVTDVDNTLTGDAEGLQRLLELLREAGERVAVGIATGRNLKLTRDVLEHWDIPTPQLLITSVGSAIHYGPHLVEDRGWDRHINYRWRPEALSAAMTELPGLKLQDAEQQSRHKISYDVDPEAAPSLREIRRHLRRSRLQAKVIYSHRAYLDLLPIRASKGRALRHIADKWGIPLDCCLVAGDSGNDEEMLTGNTLGVVVGNYDPDLEKLRGNPRIYFAQGHHAWGIIEGIGQYNFLGQIRIPDQKVPAYETVAG
ncbi:MAG TPA: HAD-IIB family hydrolase [Phycisphaerae bacterium]|nr:HAD-IIB family hydrolase [Phycisphaerae bacterium]